MSLSSISMFKKKYGPIDVSDSFQELIEHLGAVFYILDPEATKYLFLSPAFETLWRKSHQEALENLSSCFSSIAPEDLPRVKSFLKVLTQGNPSEVEYRIRRGKEYTWIHDRAFPIIGKDGNLKKITGLQENITEKKKTQSLLEESESRFKIMADSSPILFWVSGEDSSCNFLNKQWLEFTGMKFDEAIGTGWSKAVHPDDLPHVMRDYLENFENKKNFELLFRLKRHDGEYRWVLAYGVPRYGSKGSFEGFLGSCVDITERKSTEENLKKITEQLL